MKKSVLTALVLGAVLSVTACDDNKVSQQVEQAKASVSEAKETVVSAAQDVNCLLYTSDAADD